ncbi:MAG: hypothetical protein ACI4TV_07100 [Paludibacteraceae bacterium]
MKKIFMLFAVIAMALTLNAQTPVLGVDYEWKYISESMTEIPSNFCEGVSADDAITKLLDEFAIGVLYGNLPAEGGEFNVVKAVGIDDYSLVTMAWSDIVTAVTDYDDYYLPVCIDNGGGQGGETALKETTVAPKVCKHIINGQIILQKGTKQYNVLGAEIR